MYVSKRSENYVVGYGLRVRFLLRLALGVLGLRLPHDNLQLFSQVFFLTSTHTSFSSS